MHHMDWQSIREQHPHRWLLVEALQARSEGGKRLLDDLSVVEVLGEPQEAMERYLRLHRRAPDRELYVVHSDRERLDVEERRWLGLRSG